MDKKIRVLLVDDSAVVRQVLAELINTSQDIEVIATAPDPVIARSKMEKEWPDVIITDIEMPRMDGITFIEQVMKEHPTPMIVCSSHTDDSASMSMRALSAGAVDIIGKPKAGVKDFLHESETMITDAIRSAFNIDLKRINKTVRVPSIEPKLSPDAMIPPLKGKLSSADGKDPVVIIGASAGGTQALERVLSGLPLDCPPIAIVQHMPEFFTRAFADRLNSVCSPSISEGSNGDTLAEGKVIIAPGGKHMMLSESGSGYCVSVKDGPLVSRHRPSVDVLFRSAARSAGRNALGIILTGMGDDGALGMFEMHESGIMTIAQSEESCAVFGMPKEAIRRGGVDKIIHLDEIPNAIMSFYASRKKHQ